MGATHAAKMSQFCAFDGKCFVVEFASVLVLLTAYEEGMQFGMIGWYVLSLYPADYGENPKMPLPLVALASQKSGMVLHFL